jgi:hypothetical protein
MKQSTKYGLIAAGFVLFSFAVGCAVAPIMGFALLFAAAVGVLTKVTSSDILNE